MTNVWHVLGRIPESDEAPRLVPIRGERYPALLLASLVAIGVSIADRTDHGPLIWTITALIALVGMIVLWRSGRHRLWLMVGAAVFAGAIGAWRMAVELDGRPAVALTELIDSGEHVEVYGSLAGIPREKLRGWSTPIDVVSVRSRSEVIPLRVGALLSTLAPMSGFHHGDCVRLTAHFEAPFVRRNPGGFDYANYLFRQGIDAVVRPADSIVLCGSDRFLPSVANLVEPVRSWLRRVFTVYLPKPARSLILGFLLGDTDQLAPGVMAAFRDSGTLHLLAVSGANVWLLVGLFIWPMRVMRVPRWPRAIMLVVLVVAFSFLTRNEPSVVRASLMVAFILIGRLLYRPISLLNAVGASALVILLVSPSQLFRPGFQLSYAAVIGIALVGQRTARWSVTVKPPWLRMVMLGIVSSVAATVATAPVVAWHFGMVSLASLVANLAMIPLAAAGLYSCLAVALLSILSVAVAGWIAYPAAKILELSSYLAELFARMPGAQFPWPNPSPIWILHFYAVGLLALNWRHRYRWVRPATWYAAALAAILILNDMMKPPSPEIALAYLDAGATRVAACSHPDGSLIWLVDDPGITDQLRQWVTVPFVRAQIGRVTSEQFHSWRRSDSGDTAIEQIASAPSKYPAPVWRRYTSADRRIWADRFAWGADTVVCLRDYPTSPPGARWLDTILGPGHTLVLPAASPDRLLRPLLDRLLPQNVVLFGAVGHWRDEDQWIELWRMRYPGVEFYSTGINGCIQILLGSTGSPVIPTVVDPQWVALPRSKA